MPPPSHPFIGLTSDSPINTRFEAKCTALLALAGVLTTSVALALPAQGAMMEHVVDGSFEAVPKSVINSFQGNIQAGNWTVQGDAVFTDDTPGAATPYGRNCVAYYEDTPRGIRGSVSQKIVGLPFDGTLTLSYYYSVVYNSVANCTFVASFGRQSIDSFGLPEQTESDPGYTQRTKVLTASQSSGILKFELACEKPARSKFFEFNLENVSLTGPSTKV